MARVKRNGADDAYIDTLCDGWGNAMNMDSLLNELAVNLDDLYNGVAALSETVSREWQFWHVLALGR